MLSGICCRPGNDSKVLNSTFEKDSGHLTVNVASTGLVLALIFNGLWGRCKTGREEQNIFVNFTNLFSHMPLFLTF